MVKVLNGVPSGRVKFFRIAKKFNSNACVALKLFSKVFPRASLKFPPMGLTGKENVV